MHKLIFLISAVLSSSLVNANVVSTLQTVEKKAYPFSSDESTVQNMPRVRSQDSFGVCFGFSSAAVAQHMICQQKKISCSKLDEKQEISPMGMVAWANTNKPTEVGGSFDHHSNIRFSGMGYGALGYLTQRSSNGMIPESCYPFDEVANKYGDNKDAVDTMLKKLKTLYDKSKTEGGACEECLVDTFKNDLGVKTSPKEIAGTLQEATYEKFLFSGMFGSCMDDFIEFKPRPNFNMFPQRGQAASSEDVIQKAKEVLKTGNPLVLDAVCPYKENDKCLGGHSVVITGYRLVCKDQAKKACRHVLKIQNSWGESWQKENDDGWVDAETMLGSKPLGEGAISWLSASSK